MSINNTIFVGKILHHFDAVNSTNFAAAEWLKQNEHKLKSTEGVVFSTFNQTAGRGQLGNGWECAPDENIAISILLRPHFLAAREQFLLNKVVALAVHDFVSAFLDNVKLKWANDIYVNDKKIAGILIQNTLSGSQIAHSIIGIGVNINQNAFQNAPNATSFAIEKGQMFDLSDMRERLCQAIEKRYISLKNNHLTAINTEYLDKMLRFDEVSIYQRTADNTVFMGKIVGTDPYGRLEIAPEYIDNPSLIKINVQGIQVEVFDIKEVKFIF